MVTSSISTTSGAPLLVGAGDVARCNGSGDEETGALVEDVLADAPEGHAIIPGDAAYPDGSDADFEDCYVPSWGSFLDRTRPALGNHEYRTSGAAGYRTTFGDVLEGLGASAVDPGRGWYSYDVGAWHVVVLNSNCDQVGGCGRGSKQVRWLRRDLTANPAACTAAYWHHPRFSSGRHGSITAVAPLVEAFHDGGGDVVITGHDHDYERFDPMDARGRRDGLFGVRQFVVGTGGGDLRPVGTPIAGSARVIEGRYGVISLGLREGSYQWEFLTPDGGRHDVGAATCHGAPNPADGDLDGDGHGDVVVGVPDEGVSGRQGAGQVVVVYGDGGAGVSHGQVLHQAKPGVPGGLEAGDRFGGAVAVADVDGDGWKDLVVGSPGEDLGSVRNAGMVSVLYGSASGFGARSDNYHQGTPGVPGGNETGDRFGAAVTVGDLDGDGVQDLVIGAPGEDSGAGAVTVLYGSGSSAWLQQGNGLQGGKESGDATGGALATGDVTGDGIVDLAVGAPGEAVGSRSHSGAVLLLAGSFGGPLQPLAITHQESSGVPGSGERGDRFGGALALLDRSGDQRAELLVGVPGEGLGGRARVGRVAILRLARSGAVLGAAVVHQNRGGVPGGNESGDLFGAAVSGWGPWLVIGSAGEDLGGRRDVGAVTVIRRRDGTWAGAMWHQGTPGVRGGNERGDHFGAAAASGPG